MVDIIPAGDGYRVITPEGEAWAWSLELALELAACFA